MSQLSVRHRLLVISINIFFLKFAFKCSYIVTYLGTSLSRSDLPGIETTKQKLEQALAEMEELQRQVDEAEKRKQLGVFGQDVVSCTSEENLDMELLDNKKRAVRVLKEKLSRRKKKR